jgi:hypothetical protein
MDDDEVERERKGDDDHVTSPVETDDVRLAVPGGVAWGSFEFRLNDCDLPFVSLDHSALSLETNYWFQGGQLRDCHLSTSGSRTSTEGCPCSSSSNPP